MKTLEELRDALNKKGYFAEVREIPKNNNICSALIVRRSPDQTIAPTFYEGIINEGLTIEETAQYIISNYDEYMKGTESFQIDDYSKDLDLLYKTAVLRVCRKEWNEKRIEDAYVKQVGETDLVFYVCAKVTFPTRGTVIVKKYGPWKNVDEDRLWKAAEENTMKDIRMQNLANFIGEPDFPENKPIFFCSSADLCNAAPALCNEMLEKACDVINKDTIVVIPSSINEILFTVDSPDGAGVFSDMITDVNRICEEGIVLSDHAYIYEKGGTLKNYEA